MKYILEHNSHAIPIKHIEKKEVEYMDSLLTNADLAKIKREIKKQHKSAYYFCKAFNLDQAELSKVLNKKKPATLRALSKYCALLNLRLSLTIQRPRIVST